MNKTLRIKAEIGSEKAINVNLSQDIDLYEILSLKISQRNMYKRFTSDYGVIVGRVLANDAFGVPNAKVSVFVPISSEDEFRTDIRNIYPYKSVTDVDNNNVRYNTLPNYQTEECHRPVGSVPKKRLVLDDDTILEVFDKYYRYTTTTNKSGDYMLFGVPTGNRIIHVDVDLSDIGILSQKPRDLIYKGYSVDLFESPSQFKISTNLDSLPQILTQNISVNVYPFWGDKDVGEISITRKDINLQYKFETTCVFMGSIMTDNGENSIGHTCVPDEKVGDASQLVPCEGTIEMIRKTTDDSTEEFTIKGNRLIDADGVFCYQIPMNLDFVGMDEKGNIVPTDNPKKGIATRARVRFRFTLNETGNSTMARHKARYLVPNNPQIYETLNEAQMKMEEPLMSSKYVYENDDCYEFGSKTPDNCYRDLYWNKVYSVKNYIPRVQKSVYENTSKYFGIKGVNKSGAKKNNLIPYNKINLNFTPSAANAMNQIPTSISENRSRIYTVIGFWNYLRHSYPDYNMDAIYEQTAEQEDAIGLDFYNDWLNGCLYFPSWYWFIREKNKKKKGESVYESQFCECNFDDTNTKTGPLYLYNNCSLVYGNRDLYINQSQAYLPNNGMFHRLNFGSTQILGGLIKKIQNKDGGELFYYTHGNIRSTERYQYVDDVLYKYARLFATDIILLGSLVDCDIDGIPQLSYDIPSTTSNIPPMGSYKRDTLEYEKGIDDALNDKNGMQEKPDVSETGDEYGEEYGGFNGMNWGHYWTTRWKIIDKSDYIEVAEIQRWPPGQYEEYIYERPLSDRMYRFILGSGLFFGLTVLCDWLGWTKTAMTILSNLFNLNNFWRGIKIYADDPYHHIIHHHPVVAVSDTKTCVNVERICELGVTLDADVEIKRQIPTGGGHAPVTEVFRSDMDGLITDNEIVGYDARAMFATLNANKLIGIITNPITGYKTYKIDYYYPTNFDGRMEYIAPAYTFNSTYDFRDIDYLDFRFGSKGMTVIKEGSTVIAGNITTDGYNIGISTGGNCSNANKPGFGGARPNGASDTCYTVDPNGAINYTSEVMQGTRHFYGTSDTDSQYHAFPLYDNSFYFFFGLNAGSTAIDKLYKNFFAYCPENNKSPITYSTDVTMSSICQNNGKIDVSISKINYPFDISLSQGASTTAYTKTYDKSFTFENLNAGTYTLNIVDNIGNSINEGISVRRYPILLYYKVIRNLTLPSGVTESGITCENMCTSFIDPSTSAETFYYGSVQFNSYSVDGKEYAIYELTKDADGKFTIIDSNTEATVTLYVLPDNNIEHDLLSNYTCTCNSEIDSDKKNAINIYRPGNFETYIEYHCEGNPTSEHVQFTMGIINTEHDSNRSDASNEASDDTNNSQN